MLSYFTHVYIYGSQYLLNNNGNNLISVILPELLKNFETVTVEVVQCPDLTQPPFNLASEG